MDDDLPFSAADPTWVWLLLMVGLALLAGWLRLILALAQRPRGDLLASAAQKESHAVVIRRFVQERVAVQRAASAGLLLLHGLLIGIGAYLGGRAWLWTALGTWLGLLLLEVWADAQIDARLLYWLPRLAPWAVAWGRMLRPLTALLDALAPRRVEQAVALSPQTLHALLEAAGEGHLAPRYQRMVYAIIRLSHTLVREIMVPRVDMVTLEVHTPLREAVRLLLESGFSRVPVYEERVDRIVGVLYSKDVLRFCWDGARAQKDLHSLVRPAYFVPEAKRADELLAEMQTRRIHMALVVDEYGGIAGLVTLEDIVEEIVGEIHDEYDQSEAPSYHKISEDEYLFWGRVDLDDVNDLLGTHFDRHIADTLGGFIYSRLGRIPQAGEHLQAEGWDIVVEKVEGNRIQQVRLRRLPPSNAKGRHAHEPRNDSDSVATSH